MLTHNLQNVRIMRARLSLNPTNGSVESIARAVGYPDRQVFGRLTGATLSAGSSGGSWQRGRDPRAQCRIWLLFLHE